MLEGAWTVGFIPKTDKKTGQLKGERHAHVELK